MVLSGLLFQSLPSLPPYSFQGLKAASKEPFSRIFNARSIERLVGIVHSVSVPHSWRDVLKNLALTFSSFFIIQPSIITYKYFKRFYILYGKWIFIYKIMLGFQLLRPILSAFDIEMWDFILDMQCRNIKGFLFIRQILLSTRTQWLIHKC